MSISDEVSGYADRSAEQTPARRVTVKGTMCEWLIGAWPGMGSCGCLDHTPNKGIVTNFKIIIIAIPSSLHRRAQDRYQTNSGQTYDFESHEIKRWISRRKDLASGTSLFNEEKS
jgi:hypothetical protein